jgi:hypothetical protein
VLDSLGRPLAEASVRLSGTPFIATADGAGHFRFDSLPGGRHTLVAEHEAYAELGLLVDDLALTIEEGEMRRVILRGERSADIAVRMCAGQRLEPGRAVVRLTMLDGGTSAPLTGLPVWIRWQYPNYGLESVTDERGVVVFCDVPGDQPLELHRLLPDGGSVPLQAIRTSPGAIVPLTVTVRPPR